MLLLFCSTTGGLISAQESRRENHPKAAGITSIRSCPSAEAKLRHLFSYQSHVNVNRIIADRPLARYQEVYREEICDKAYG
jgi:hypothetical protein